MWKDWLPQLVIALASLTAAVFWFLSSAVDISNNQDTLIAEIQRASELSGYAAFAAGIAAFVVAISFIREWEVINLIRKWFSTRFK